MILFAGESRQAPKHAAIISQVVIEQPQIAQIVDQKFAGNSGRIHHLQFGTALHESNGFGIGLSPAKHVLSNVEGAQRR